MGESLSTTSEDASLARLGVVSKTLGFLPSGMTVSIEALRPEGGVSKTDDFWTVSNDSLI